MSQPIEVAERVIRLLQEGRYTATYKQAVLLALIDLCVEAGAANTAKATSRAAARIRIGSAADSFPVSGASFSRRWSRLDCTHFSIL